MIRGTRFFDDNWYFSGVGDRKRVHVEDLTDCSIFIKNENLTEKIALISTLPSGSHAALTSVLWEPYLYHGAAVYVSSFVLTLNRTQFVTCQIT